MVYCRKKMRTLVYVTFIYYFQTQLDELRDYSRIFGSRVEVGVDLKLRNFIYVRIL